MYPSYQINQPMSSSFLIDIKAAALLKRGRATFRQPREALFLIAQGMYALDPLVHSTGYELVMISSKCHTASQGFFGPVGFTAVYLRDASVHYLALLISSSGGLHHQLTDYPNILAFTSGRIRDHAGFGIPHGWNAFHLAPL